MWIRKESGGTTITWCGVAYGWPEDGSVLDIPQDLAVDLLSIRGGGFSEAPAPVQSEPGVITEPGQAAEITEPGPVAEITEGDSEPGTSGTSRKSRAGGKDAPEA